MERFFDGMLHLYETRPLSGCSSSAGPPWSLTLFMTVATVWIFTKIPMGLLPSDDIGAIFATTEGAQGISFEELKRQQQKLVDIVLQEPNVEAFMSSVGATGSQGRRQQRLHVHETETDAMNASSTPTRSSRSCGPR